MAKARITLDNTAIEAMLKEDGVRTTLADLADRVVVAAKATAPVASGDYRESIHRESVTTDRAVERVVASDWKSHLVEARTGNLARALSSIGGA